MNQKTLWIAGVTLLIVGFLLGFVPQFGKGRDLQRQLDEARHDITAGSEKMQKQELGLLIGQVYLETNRKNFGLASQYSTTFFDRARALSGRTSDPNWQALLQSVLTKRDAVTGGLAKADPGTVESVQGLFQQVLVAQSEGK